MLFKDLKPGNKFIFASHCEENTVIGMKLKELLNYANARLARERKEPFTAVDLADGQPLPVDDNVKVILIPL